MLKSTFSQNKTCYKRVYVIVDTFHYSLLRKIFFFYHISGVLKSYDFTKVNNIFLDEIPFIRFKKIRYMGGINILFRNFQNKTDPSKKTCSPGSKSVEILTHSCRKKCVNGNYLYIIQGGTVRKTQSNYEYMYEN